MDSRPTPNSDLPGSVPLDLEIFNDGQIRTVQSDPEAFADNQELRELADASHVNQWVAGLGQRVRFYVRSARHSGKTLSFNWIRWSCVPPRQHEITVRPNRGEDTASIRWGPAQEVRQRPARDSWRDQALEQVADAVVVVEAEQTTRGEPRIIYVNQSFTVLSGFTPEDVLGRSPNFLLGNEALGDLTGPRALIAQTACVEQSLCRKDGSKYWVELDVKPMTDEAGWLVQWILVLRELKTRKPEKAVPGILEKGIDTALTGMVILDGAGAGAHFVYVNQAFCRTTGYDATELVGHASPPLCFTPIDERGWFRAAGIDFEQTLRWARKDGSEAFLRWHALSPVQSGTRQLLFALVEDITAEWTNTEKHIRESRRECIGLLTAGAAHDLNNILTSICANALLAQGQSGCDPDAVELCLHEIEQAVESASHLTRQLLKFTRTETAIEVAVALPKLLRESVKFSLMGSLVRPSFELDEACPPVLADDTSLRQAISNVVINACEAMPAGGTCTVTLSQAILTPGAFPSLLPGNYAQIVITDTGCGIRPEDLLRVFDPHFSTKENGNGLGLTVARKIVERLGGYLELRSVPFQGTTATICLPVYAGGFEETPSVDNEVIHGSGKILLVEDDARMREGLERSVRNLGYDPWLAEDGAEALELYRSARDSGANFDLVVLDLTVPGGLGAKATLPKLRELDPHVRVVVASGYNEADVLSSVSEMGFDALLRKPHTLSELSHVLASALAVTA
ncbi:MAG TPA: ATP-binding protein [Chthoniobacterales bacterium]